MHLHTGFLACGRRLPKGLETGRARGGDERTAARDCQGSFPDGSPVPPNHTESKTAGEGVGEGGKGGMPNYSKDGQQCDHCKQGMGHKREKKKVLGKTLNCLGGPSPDHDGCLPQEV